MAVSCSGAATFKQEREGRALGSDDGDGDHHMVMVVQYW